MARRVIGTIIVVLLATGCAATFWAGNKSTTLSIGMSKQQAQAMFGAPQQVMSQELEGMMVETWKYMDRALTFHNGLLYSWVNTSGGQGN